jgi:flagellar biosynthetic protein FliQ
MTSDQALDLLSALLQVVVFVSGPVLLASLMAGLIVGIVQAATQINEPSVSFVAKAAAVMVTLLVVGPALAAQLIEYTRNSLQSVEHVVR